jgi:hypothetical protein
LELTGAEARRSRAGYLQNRIARLRRPPRQLKCSVRRLENKGGSGPHTPLARTEIDDA